jgi:hypothetical protein
VATWVAGIVALHVGLNGHVLRPFQKLYRPILVLEVVIVVIAAAIVRSAIVRRRAIADTAARGDPPGGTIYGPGAPPRWLPVTEAVEIAVAGGCTSEPSSRLCDVVLAPSYVVIRRWDRSGPADTVTVLRMDITGVFRRTGRGGP